MGGGENEGIVNECYGDVDLFVVHDTEGVTCIYGIRGKKCNVVLGRMYPIQTCK